MKAIQENLTKAIIFLRTQAPPKLECNNWIERLTNDLLLLDEMERSYKRRETILAVENVITQLEQLYEKEKSPILIQYYASTERKGYLACDDDSKIKSSTWALGDTFTENLQ